MWRRRSIHLALSASIGIASFASNAIAQHRDDFVYNRILQIKGHVTIVGQPDVVASGMYLVFQRDGCKDCLVATHTDAEGNYQIFVGRGRYKLIVRDGAREGEMTDSLPADQPRYINATHIVGGETFDVRIVVRERLRSNAAPNKSLDRSGGCAFCIIIGAAKVE